MVSTAKSISVLIVDDSPIVRSDLRTLLSLFDCINAIREASDLRSTLLVASESKPDLILLDLQLGSSEDSELSGLSIIRNLKNLIPSCLIYVLTVHGYNSARQEAKQEGADAFFIKGQDEQDMFASIKKIKLPSKS